jgi:hypothetical protein
MDVGQAKYVRDIGKFGAMFSCPKTLLWSFCWLYTMFFYTGKVPQKCARINFFQLLILPFVLHNSGVKILLRDKIIKCVQQQANKSLW